MKLRKSTFLKYNELLKNTFNCEVCNKSFAIGDIYDIDWTKVHICKKCLDVINSK